MPLPTDSAAWPPKPWDIANEQYAINEAWYLGDTDRLSQLYGASNEQRPSHQHGGQQMAGGVMGKLTRFFWGRPIPQAQNRTRLHLPAASDLAVLSSDLMFAEPPEVRLRHGEGGGTNRVQQERLDLIANSPEAHSTWNTMGELKAVFGAAAIVTQWDRNVADHPWLSAQAADVVVPEFVAGRLSALTLWSEWTSDAQVSAVSTFWRHLERHEQGYIVHALYKGTRTSLGTRVSVKEQPRTEHLALIDGSFDDGLAIVIPTGIQRLTASYNLNMPSRAWRRKGDLAHAGRSDYGAAVLGLFDTLDEVWSSWVRDIRLARARLVVPEGYLDYTGPGQAAQFDPDQEIFSPVAAMYRPGEAGIQMEQPDIRVEQHERTVFAVYRELLRAAGYSPSAWGDYGGGVGRNATATEIQDRDKASERTRDKKALYDRRAIAEQSAAALDIDAAVFGGRGAAELPTVSFPPASQIDPLKNSQTIANLRAASAITVKTGVQMAHPDWDDTRVGQEVTGIMRETGLAIEDPNTLRE